MSRPIVLRSIEEGINKYPYFFQNELIDKSIYIVQKAIDIPNALYIIDVWNREKFNIGDIERYIGTDDISYTQYFYNSNTDIKKEDINGGSDQYKIICYKKDDGFNVCALLKYSI